MRLPSKRHLVAGCAVFVACAGGDDRDAADAGTPRAGATAASTGDVSRGAPAASALVALGDSVFHGQVAGGLCVTCHGPDAKGTQLGPNLTDDEWLNGDGTEASIASVVTNGVATPKEYPSPMPPKGGGSLTDAQIRAVAAYVASLGAS